MIRIFLLAFTMMVIIILVLKFVFHRNFRKILSQKLIGRFLIVYVCLLVLATGAYFMLQPKFITQNNIVEKPFMHDVLKQSNDVEFSGKYEVNSWEIALENQQLFLETAADFAENVPEEPHDVYFEADVYIPVLIKREEVDKAQVIVYETPTRLARLDISDYVTSPTVNVKDNHVVVTPASESETKFHSIRNDMTFNQFSDRWSKLDIHYELEIAEVGLVITVPKDTKVEANPEYFDIIE